MAVAGSDLTTVEASVEGAAAGGGGGGGDHQSRSTY